VLKYVYILILSMKRLRVGIGIIAGLAIAVTVLMTGLVIYQLQFRPGACTQDAKLCPGGVSIGRSGPNCEFPSCPKPFQSPVIPGLFNATYTVGGEVFTLIDGRASHPVVPGSVTMNTLQVFQNPTIGDLNGDGQPDAAVLLVNNPGGSGTFYYAVLAMNENGAYRATNALLMGDRISPQTVEIHDGRSVFNYADRKPGEPMTTQPSVGKSLWIQYDPTTGEISEWVNNGESSISLPEAQARAIAERSCIKGGEALGPGTHNRATQTWWFDANLNATKQGCNPACVVSEVSKTADINWRCTGLVTPTSTS
jgi:hypothetical protein